MASTTAIQIASFMLSCCWTICSIGVRLSNTPRLCDLNRRFCMKRVKLSGYFKQHLTNRSSQPLAVPMSSFSMTSMLNCAANLAAASGG
jgi:hypothetical protein